jgi:DNA-binding LacI/PurR family transcriptional regulator
MNTTLHDVAREAGVSIKTVSNVINGRPNIRDSTKQRVLDAVSKLGYAPNLSARSLRMGRTGMIGLALPELTLPYFAELADKVITAAEKRGLVVLIEQTNRSRSRELEVLRGTRPRMIDGLLYSPLELTQEDTAHVEIDFPLVVLGEDIFGGRADNATMQNFAGAQAATEYLLSLGRRRIAVIGAHPEVIGPAKLRFQGYQAALEGAGIALDDSLIGHVELWHRQNGAEVMNAIISRGVPFDAVFAFNDTLALGAIHTLQVRGLRVPDDVAVIGWDAIDEGAYSSPALTSVDPGQSQIADRALEMLMERITTTANGEQLPRREFEAPFTIIQRGSSGPLRNIG